MKRNILWFARVRLNGEQLTPIKLLYGVVYCDHLRFRLFAFVENPPLSKKQPVGVTIHMCCGNVRGETSFNLYIYIYIYIYTIISWHQSS